MEMGCLIRKYPFKVHTKRNYNMQECIPVGCVLSAAVAAGGACIPACTGKGGVFQHVLGRGVCISACTGQGVSAQGVSE